MPWPNVPSGWTEKVLNDRPGRAGSLDKFYKPCGNCGAGSGGNLTAHGYAASMDVVRYWCAGAELKGGGGGDEWRRYRGPILHEIGDVYRAESGGQVVVCRGVEGWRAVDFEDSELIGGVALVATAEGAASAGDGVIGASRNVVKDAGAGRVGRRSTG